MYHKNKRTIQNIHKLIDNIEQKLNKDSYDTYDTYDINSINLRYSKPNINDYHTNISYENFSTQPQISNSLNESIIRRIIREEFNTLIIPHQQEMFNQFNIIESKINKNNIQIKEISLKNEDISLNYRNSMNNNDYILKNEYENKMNEIEDSLSSILPLIRALKEKLDKNMFLNNDNINILENKFINKNDFELKIKELKDIMNEETNKYNKVNNDIYKINLNINDLNTKIKNAQIKSEELENNINNNVNNNIKDIKSKLGSDWFMKLYSINVEAINKLIYNINYDDIKNSFYRLEKNIKDLEQKINNEARNNYGILQRHEKDINQLKVQFNKIIQDFDQLKGQLNENENIKNQKKKKIKSSVINKVEEINEENNEFDNDINIQINNTNNKNNDNISGIKKSKYKIESLNDEIYN